MCVCLTVSFCLAIFDKSVPMEMVGELVLIDTRRIASTFLMIMMSLVHLLI